MIARPTDFSNFEQYSKLLTIWHNQQNQDLENQRNHDNFLTDSSNWLAVNLSYRDHGQPLTSPPNLPQHKTYNDDGSVTFSSFPDLKLPQLPISTSPGPIVNPNPPMDRTDAILMLQNQMMDILNQILAKLPK
jgi:hypothetical protein